MSLLPRRLATRLASIPTRVSFTMRLTATFIAALGTVGTGLYLVQTHDTRRIVIADGAQRHLARGLLIEARFTSATGTELPWDEVREVLEQVATQPGIRGALVISSSGRAVAASDPADEGTDHARAQVTQVIRDGRPAFESAPYDGQESFEYLSRIQLGGRPYVFEVALDPILLTAELAALKGSTLRAMGLGTLLALPLLYLLGGRGLAKRYSAAEDRATLDGLTGLNNHRSFQEALCQEVARTKRFGEPFTLALVDVDDFKFVNDSQGHRRGDDVLVKLAAALRTSRSVDLAFRVGGDEFALIMPRTGLDEASTVVEAFRQTALLRMDGTTISLGLAEFDPTDTDAAMLRDRADSALYEAKRRGRNQTVTFPQIGDLAPTRASASTLVAVRNLLASRRMSAAFQPIWDLDTHRVLGYEGLARPAQDYGLAGPESAFSGAARLGRVDELDALCRMAVLAQAGDLPADVLLFLNISPEVFDHGGGAGQRLRHEVEAAGLHPRRVVIELTEQSSERMDLVIAQMLELRALGFGLALDDVGGGDTGLGLLAKIRPDYVKVDRGVLCSALEGGPGRAVLAAITAYAAESQALLIAEGIETEALLDLVRLAGTGGKPTRIVGAQGYLLGRPSIEPPWQQAAGMTWPLADEVLRPA